MCHNSSRADDRAIPNMDAFENERSAANPDAITNDHWLRSRRIAIHTMLVGIHDDDIPGNHAVAADTHLLLSNDFCVAVQRL